MLHTRNKHNLAAGSIFLFGGLLAVLTLLTLTKVPQASAKAEIPGLSLYQRQAAPGDWVLYQATLVPQNEVPPVTDTVGSGKALLLLDKTTNSLWYTILYRGIDNPIAAHIHEGTFGVNGPVVVDLSDVLTPIYPKISMKIIEPAVAENLGGGGYYVNVHNEAHPGGVMRGQVSLVTQPPMGYAHLSGGSIAPPVDTLARGTGMFSLSPDMGTLTYTISVTDITNITSASLGTVTPGQEIQIFPAGSVPFDPEHPLTGSTAITPEQLALYLSGQYSLTIATEAHPEGEIGGKVFNSASLVFQFFMPTLSK